MTIAAQAGKSAAQVKYAGGNNTTSSKSKGESEMDNLLLEKGRLENQIKNLQTRLKRVMELLYKEEQS